jgi:hypothetical protein
MSLQAPGIFPVTIVCGTDEFELEQFWGLMLVVYYAFFKDSELPKCLMGLRVIYAWPRKEEIHVLFTSHLFPCPYHIHAMLPPFFLKRKNYYYLNNLLCSFTAYLIKISTCFPLPEYLNWQI